MPRIEPSPGKPVAVDPWQIVDFEQQRHGNGFKGNDERGEDDRKENILSAPVQKGKGECGKRAKQQGEKHGNGRYQNRVEYEGRNRRPGESRGVVFKRQISNRQESAYRGRITEQLVVRFQRREAHEQERQNEDRRESEHEHIVADEKSEALALSGLHHCFSLVRYRWVSEMHRTSRKRTTEIAEPAAMSCCRYPRSTA